MKNCYSRKKRLLTKSEREKFDKKFGNLIGELNERKLSKKEIILLIVLPLVRNLACAMAVTQLYMYPPLAITLV